jgi:hypothetical protein
MNENQVQPTGNKLTLNQVILLVLGSSILVGLSGYLITKTIKK